MYLSEAIRYFEELLMHDTTEDFQKRNAIKNAIDSMKVVKNSLLVLGMDTDGFMTVNINTSIGTMMTDEDVSDDVAGQRYYAMEALAFAIVAMAKDQVDDGYDMEETFRLVMNSFAQIIEEIFEVKVEVGELAAGEILGRAKEKEKKSKELLS